MNLKNNLKLAQIFVRFYMSNEVVYCDKRDTMWTYFITYLWRGTNKDKKMKEKEIANDVYNNLADIKLIARVLWDIKLEQSQDLDNMIYKIYRLNTWSDKNNGNYPQDIREKFQFGSFVLNSVMDELKAGQYRAKMGLDSKVKFEAAWDIFIEDVTNHIK